MCMYKWPLNYGKYHFIQEQVVQLHQRSSASSLTLPFQVPPGKKPQAFEEIDHSIYFFGTDGFFSVHCLEMNFTQLCFMCSSNSFVKICVLTICIVCVVCFYFIFKVLVQLRSGLLKEVINTLEAAVEVDTPPFVKRTEFSEQVVSIQWWEKVHGTELSHGSGGSPTELRYLSSPCSRCLGAGTCRGQSSWLASSALDQNT